MKLKENINSDIINFLKKYKKEIERIFISKGVILSYLFGSSIKSNFSKLSDIDIAVLLKREIDCENYFKTKLDLSVKLFEILRNLKTEIDIVILNESSITLKYQVIKYGEVIYKLDEKTRVNFETSVVDYYLDTKPLRDESFKYLLKRIEDGRIGVVFRP
ncbi:MAG TPA: nucleotidyltransferase domain-containing protein [Caldisericia bacterium]|nr:nucleotidyltransferase domain-containing protein [Caldisericia bacterium]